MYCDTATPLRPRPKPLMRPETQKSLQLSLHGAGVLETTTMGHIGIIGTILGFYGDNGKQNENYYIFGTFAKQSLYVDLTL